MDDYTTRNELLNASKGYKIDISNVEICSIRINKLWTKSTSKGKSIFKLAEKSPLIQKNGRGAIDDLNNLLEIVKSYGEQ